MRNLKRTRMITAEDNFFTEEERKFVLDYCKNARFRYGVADSSQFLPTGMVADIYKNEKIYKLFSDTTKKYAPGREIYWMHVNLFVPKEVPYFHVDSEEEGDLTFLYYPNSDWHFNDLGSTEFFVNDQVIGVPPIPNRLIYFDSQLRHRATTFRSDHRFNVIIKYKSIENLKKLYETGDASPDKWNISPYNPI